MSQDDDDSMSAEYRALNAARQAKRANNREHSTQLLREAGVRFTSHNGGAHLIVQHPAFPDGPTFDFYPGTGRWQARGTTRAQFGVKKLLERLKKAP